MAGKLPYCGVDRNDVEYVQDYEEHGSPFLLAEILLMAAMNEQKRGESLRRLAAIRNWLGRSYQMTGDKKQGLAAQDMSIQIVWRNQSASVSAHLRARQQNNPYCRWAEQAGKIRARRSNWDAKHVWIA